MAEVKWPMVRCARCGRAFDAVHGGGVQDLANDRYYCYKCFQKMKKETGVSTVGERIEHEQAEKVREQLRSRKPGWIGRNGYWFGGILIILAGAAMHWLVRDEFLQKWGLWVLGIGALSVVCYFLKRILEKKGKHWL